MLRCSSHVPHSRLSAQTGAEPARPSPLASSLASYPYSSHTRSQFVIIALCNRSSRAVGRVLSRRVLPGDPLAKARTMHKFEAQVWSLVVHVSMSALEHYILFIEDGRPKEWWSHYPALWTPHPHMGGQTNSPSIHLLYLLQMALWLATSVQHRFVEERHKDYFLMYAHHLVSIALVGASYYYNFVRVGVVVLYLHDVSDIPTDLVKLFNYCKLDGVRGLFLTEIMFITNLIAWTYYRLNLLASYVLYHAVIIGAREIGTQPYGPHEQECFGRRNAFGLPPLPPAARGHPPAWAAADGSFDLSALSTSVRALPTHPCIALYWPMVLLLCALQAMHVMWYMMFWRILYKLLTADSAHEVGAEEYEGDSDDDKDD